MSLTCQVQIILNNLSSKKTKTIKEVLGPDNVKFPKGLSLIIENKENKLILNFEGKNNMKQLIGTIDEVMEHVQVSLKVIK